jgi:hypothetical protein
MDPIEVARRMVALLRSGELSRRLWELPPEDPLQPVREPRPIMPGGLRSSISVDEPEVDELVTAAGPRR